MVAHTSNTSYARGWPRQKSISKLTTGKTAGGRVQVVQHLPSKYKALSSNLSTPKKETAAFTEMAGQALHLVFMKGKTVFVLKSSGPFSFLN
jgi:hypothetical protein